MICFPRLGKYTMWNWNLRPLTKPRPMDPRHMTTRSPGQRVTGWGHSMLENHLEKEGSAITPPIKSCMMVLSPKHRYCLPGTAHVPMNF